MNRIKHLSPKVFNMIAAGEVVERPSSVVKELVENSLDAGATAVIVEISEGGTKLIKVSDNGCGMSKDDLEICTLPHTTSKLFSAEDLSCISTFGFRGEALASINAVSKLKIITCSNGSAYEYTNGQISESSKNQGTTVEIKDLFYNTPARLKFLKSFKTEERYVEDTVTHLILANPDVSFTLIAEGKTVLTSNGKGPQSALYAVFKNNGSKFLELNYQKGDFKLSGYISAPQFTRPSRSGQVIIINGRVVSDAKITVAVEKAYGNMLMKHSFPLYAISAIMPFDFVDVNVHPQKSEVRFENPDKVFSLFYSAVAETLKEKAAAFSLDSLSESFKHNENFNSNTIKTPSSEFFTNPSPLIVDSSAQNKTYKPLNSINSKTTNTEHDGLEKKELLEHISASSFESRINSAFSESNKSDKFIFDTPVDTSNDDFSALKTNNAKNNILKADSFDASKESAEDIKILCALFDTYLIIRQGEKYYIGDQHAIHERILYDSLLQSIKDEKVQSQPMLFGYKETLSAAEVDKINSLTPQLERLGFTIVTTKNEIEVLAMPSIMTNLKIKQFLHDIITSFATELSVSDFLFEKICQTACKAAIKAGYGFNEMQLDAMAEYLNKNGLPKQCPHGRPAVIEITKSGLEKLFKRIV